MKGTLLTVLKGNNSCKTYLKLLHQSRKCANGLLHIDKANKMIFLTWFCLFNKNQ
jgi:hypothetical protein